LAQAAVVQDVQCSVLPGNPYTVTELLKWCPTALITPSMINPHIRTALIAPTNILRHAGLMMNWIKILVVVC